MGAFRNFPAFEGCALWSATCIQPGIMGTTRPFNNPTHSFEAEEALLAGSPQLYVMPAPPLPLLDEELPFPISGKGGKLIYMPARWGVGVAPAKSRRQYRGNAVECWPKGYPTHDDL
jgi:hypothetical protein